jgi:hypothetical protein
MNKITPDHLARSAYVYVRQSTPDQLANNPESRRRQYALATRARSLGWENVIVIDDDLGRSGGGAARPGFERLLAAICTGTAGSVFAIEASRLARNGRDWHTLLEFCSLVNSLIIETPLRPWVFHCLLGLLSVTGLRISEALDLMALTTAGLGANALASTPPAILVTLDVNIAETIQHHTALREPTVEGPCVPHPYVNDARRVLLVDQRSNKRAKMACERTDAATAKRHGTLICSFHDVLLVGGCARQGGSLCPAR